jgi:chemotaxis protein CheD
MRNYFDHRQQKQIHILQPADFYVVEKNEVISTVLGSCIAVCLRDKKNKIGGMNHFLLPYNLNDKQRHWPGDYQSTQLRYGNISMELLINQLILKGADRQHFEAKIFGAASVLLNCSDIGERNLIFVREYLEAESIPIVSEDVGGVEARKILYNVEDGEVIRFIVSMKSRSEVDSSEKNYHKNIIDKPIISDIDFFGDN